MERPVSIKQLISALAATVITIVLAFAAVFIITLATLDARAATPATVTVIGTPSSRRIDCGRLRQFTEDMVAMRERGATIEQAHAEAINWQLRSGETPESACKVINSVNAIWVLEGGAAEIGKATYETCMQGRT